MKLLNSTTICFIGNKHTIDLLISLAHLIVNEQNIPILGVSKDFDSAVGWADK